MLTKLPLPLRRIRNRVGIDYALIEGNQQIDGWRLNSKLPKKRCDLAAMLGLMIDDVLDFKPDRVCPGFTLKIHVRNPAEQLRFIESLQLFSRPMFDHFPPPRANS